MEMKSGGGAGAGDERAFGFFCCFLLSLGGSWVALDEKGMMLSVGNRMGPPTRRFKFVEIWVILSEKLFGRC